MIINDLSGRRLVRLAGATQGEGLPVYFGPVEWTPDLVLAYHRWASLHHLRTLLALPKLTIGSEIGERVADTRFACDG